MASGDFLLEKLVFSASEHGRMIFYETEGTDRSRGVLSLKASGLFGSISFREVEAEAYTFGFGSYEIMQDMTLTTMMHLPYLGIFINVGNDLAYGQEGLSGGTVRQNECSIISLPYLHIENKLYKGHTYSVFGIVFQRTHLQQWAARFPSLSRFFSKVEKNIPFFDQFELSMPEKVRDMISDLIQMMAKGAHNRSNAMNRINDILLYIFNSYEGVAGRTKLYPWEVEKLHEIRKFLLTHPEEGGLSLKQLSHNAGMNVFKLKYGFKKLFGIPVFKFFFEERMKIAKALIAQKKKPINEIAGLVGYKNVASFSAAFRKRFGYPPSAVR